MSEDTKGIGRGFSVSGQSLPVDVVDIITGHVVARIEWLPVTCKESGGGDTELNEPGVVGAVVEFTTSSASIDQSFSSSRLSMMRGTHANVTSLPAATRNSSSSCGPIPLFSYLEISNLGLGDPIMS